MIRRVIGKLFGKRKAARASREFATELLRGIVENEAATAMMQADARNSSEPCALLTPVVPLPAQQHAGWFGGMPRLPGNIAWPEIEGEPLRFICQLDLSALPENIWSGLGPRRGWLAVFLHPEKLTPKVLHIEGELKRREGPGQTDAVWFWPRAYDKQRPPLQAHSPEWPIAVMEHVGQLPPPAGWRKGKAPGFPDPRDAESPDLSNAAFHPFNEATLSALLESVRKQLNERKARIDGLLQKKCRDETRTELERMQPEASRALERFSLIEDALLPFTKEFELGPVGELVAQLSALPSCDTNYLKNDEEGYAVITSAIQTLCEKPDPRAGGWWYWGYADRLYRHAIYAYTSTPEALHPELRLRMETIWQFEARHECGAMGHAPLGHVYTPHGPATRNAVLLGFPTSSMVGWAWGDMYSLVLFIDRDDLSRGDFSNVIFDITN
ncbi:DUF1963 domain-containing protein [Parvibaculum sp.]|uniref:DUF1963 domain-containing protein n=1 Tax=Parvibaculum sp. TaxID=2024848 RepID=UPI0034A08722